MWSILWTLEAATGALLHRSHQGACTLGGHFPPGTVVTYATQRALGEAGVGAAEVVGLTLTLIRRPEDDPAAATG